MTAVLSLALMLGGAVSAQTPWNMPLQSNLYEHSVNSWIVAGTDPKGYFMRSRGGCAGFELASNDDPSPNDVATAYRSVSADKFYGKRARVSLEIHTQGVQVGTGLWLRVDDKAGKPLVLKDMEHNLIVGSRPWATYELVVDVPDNAAQIGYGIVLVGRGAVFFQNVKVEALDRS